MYYFHLKLELYHTPAASQSHLLATTAATDDGTPHIHVPPTGCDIFTTPLPAHRTSTWSSYNFSKAAEPPTSPSFSSLSSDPSHLKDGGEHHDSHGDTLLLPERTFNRNYTSKSPPRTPAKPSNESAAKDWRYNAVSIESINMETAGGGAMVANRIAAGPVKSTATNGLRIKASYIPSDPITTEVGWGVVHLYRDTDESPDFEGGTGHDVQHGSRKSNQNDGEFNTEDCTTLCIVAVPSWMMPSDLLGFVGDQAREDVSHFRLIRTARTNKYMVLMKFRSAAKARDWQKANNGRLFSAAEPENCHVVFVKSVEFLNSDPRGAGSEEQQKFPHNNHDPFTPAYPSGAVVRPEKSLSSKPLAPPPPNLLELPTCPVCLERMDDTTGLLTILCQHVFHCACLEKWRFTGSGCPVCRYTQSPSHTFPYPRPSSQVDGDAEPLCSVCATNVNVNLWVCLICGNIGCGRYDSAHAYAHYEATSHCYAMDLNTQRVWDYAGDGYVHRLIQSKPDFNTSSQTQTSSGTRGGALDTSKPEHRHENEAYRAEAGDMVPREKMESMANEYAYLLTSQLEGQRRYFEEQVERAVDKASEASAKAEAASTRADAAVTEMHTSQAARTSLEEAVQRLEKALERADCSRGKFEQLARDMSTQLREEKAMNEGLLQRIHAAEEKAAQARSEADQAREEKRELEDMNRDLTVFISSQEKVRELQAQGEEVVDGSVSVPVPVPEAGRKKGKGRKR